MNKTLILTILVSMFLFNFVSAEYLPHQQDTQLNFSVTSNFATTCTLSTINTPTGITTINQVDTSIGTFDFSVAGGNFSTIGTYCMNIVCTDGTDYTTGQECREITSSGEVYNQSQLSIILAQGIIIALFVGLAFSFSKDKWKIRGFFFTLALLFGLMMLNSIRVMAGVGETLNTMADSGVIIGIIAVSFMAIYLLIYYTIEVIHYFKNKKEMKWQVSDNPA